LITNTAGCFSHFIHQQTLAHRQYTLSAN
jgi:hypothetical protein